MRNMKQRESLEGTGTKKDADIITNLPAHITDRILSHLCLRDAVRTSVLSSKWRYKWAALPSLVFDNQSILISTPDQTQVRNKVVNIVDHVLLLHAGPIHKFKLSHRDLQAVTDIDKWIVFLSRGAVKEFILEIWKGCRYKLPSALYLCQKLIHLELFNCLLKPPSTFTGYKSLKSLDLQHITMDQSAFEYMISSCPLLERLTLMNFDGFSLLNVHAPNLLFFDVGGIFDDINLKDTSNLAVVSIGQYLNTGDTLYPVTRTTVNIIKFFAALPHVQRLEVQSFFLKFLTAGFVPGKLPASCLDLNFLSIRINFNDNGENLAAVCILRSSPNLQELELLARTEETTFIGGSASNALENSHSLPFFYQLRVIKIIGISGIKQELNFINFLLANSPVLEKLTVRPVTSDVGWELVKKLLRFRRASVHAEIVYVDP